MVGGSRVGRGARARAHPSGGGPTVAAHAPGVAASALLSELRACPARCGWQGGFPVGPSDPGCPLRPARGARQPGPAAREGASGSREGRGRCGLPMGKASRGLTEYEPIGPGELNQFGARAGPMGRREEPLLAWQREDHGELGLRELGKQNRHAIDADPRRRLAVGRPVGGRQEKNGAWAARVDGDPTPQPEAVPDRADSLERFPGREPPNHSSSRPPPPHPGAPLAQYRHIDSLGGGKRCLEGRKCALGAHKSGFPTLNPPEIAKVAKPGGLSG